LNRTKECEAGKKKPKLFPTIITFGNVEDNKETDNKRKQMKKTVQQENKEQTQSCSTKESRV